MENRKEKTTKMKRNTTKKDKAHFCEKVKKKKNSYLVDPASSDMLVSKIKPCMSEYKLRYGETANGSINQLLFI